jgi:OHCU decarboxylase
MAAERPFRNLAALLETASRVWRELPESEWQAAFAAHARIGDVGASGQGAREQAAIRSASRETLDGLTLANRHYEQRFGRVFLVCATGRTGEQMLAACLARLHNDAPTELRISAEEQRKITALRLRKLAANA